MDKRIDFIGINPDIRIDQINIDSAANRLALFAMMDYLSVGTNPNYIISGCVVTVGGNSPNNTWSLASGYIYLNGEVVQVEAQSGNFDSVTQFLAFSKSVTYDTRGDITYQDGTPRQTWQKNRGVITVKSSVLTTELDAINGDSMDDKLRTYIGTATTSTEGVAEFSSYPEAQAGSAVDKMISPDTLLNAIRNGVNYRGTTSLYGVVRTASESEGQVGTAGKVIPADVHLATKTFRDKGQNTITNPTGTVTVSNTYDRYYLSAGNMSIVMPSPTGADQYNRVVTLYSNTASNLTITILNTNSSGSQKDQFYFSNGVRPGLTSNIDGALFSFISDGNKWLCLSYEEVGVACPYIYVNGVYFEEILKNYVGISNYKEEIIDVTEVLKSGDNIIRLSEEKKETTYIDYLILNIDGEDQILFNERRIIKQGSYFDFGILAPKEFNKATLRAKGYYIKG